MYARGKRSCLSALILIIVAVFGGTQESKAQVYPQQILGAVIQQLQTGTPNPGWYGGQLWMMIANQTNNSGMYVPLAQLGPVQNISLLNQVQLPSGPLYSLSAQHSGGISTWTIGISVYTNRIEYANFNINGSQPPLPPPPITTTPIATAPVSMPGTTPTPPVGPPPTASPTSDACKKFPTLC